MEKSTPTPRAGERAASKSPRPQPIALQRPRVRAEATTDMDGNRLDTRPLHLMSDPDGLFPVGGYPGNDDDGRALQAKLDRRLSRWDPEQVELELSVKDRDTASQRAVSIASKSAAAVSPCGREAQTMAGAVRCMPQVWYDWRGGAIRERRGTGSREDAKACLYGEATMT